MRLARLLGVGGFFVEAGANDGYRQSNTYYLERFCGWSGVLVEAVPSMAERCARRRPNSQVFNCALVSSGYEGSTVKVAYADLLSRVGDAARDANWGWEQSYEIDVPACTLTWVLESANVREISALFLDVEGFEMEVLEGLDLDRFAPRFIVLEVLDGDLSRFSSILRRYYLVQWLSPRDALLALAP